MFLSLPIRRSVSKNTQKNRELKSEWESTVGKWKSLPKFSSGSLGKPMWSGVNTPPKKKQVL